MKSPEKMKINEKKKKKKSENKKKKNKKTFTFILSLRKKLFFSGYENLFSNFYLKLQILKVSLIKAAHITHPSVGIFVQRKFF